MTEAYAAAGRPGLSASEAFAAGEAVLVDRLIDLLMALEPFEIKQSVAPVEQAAGPAEASGPVTGGEAAKPSVESTRAMLARMRAVLDREAARLGEDGLEGKAAVDQVALIARTLEKIDQMERLIAEDQARAAGGRLGPEEREQLRQTVRQLILSAAERMVAERAAGPEDASEAAELGDAAERGEGAVEMSDGENVAEDFSDRTEAETR